MSFIPFKEVTVANPGSATRYGSDDLLDVMKILNAKVVANRRPEIINPWRWSSWQEIKQVTESSVTTPTDANVVNLFLSASDNKLKVKKTGGTIINLEDIGSGTWSNTSTETFSNKTVNFDTNTLKHSTTNAQGDVMFYDTSAGKYIRLAKGTANQSLTVNAAGTTLEWQTVTGGGGGGETNTASNVGSAGIGVFHQKTGVDLEFKKIFSPDGSVNISDDTGNQKIDLTLAGALVKTSQSNTYGDFNQTFRSSRFLITNPANTFNYTFVGSAILGARNITLPLLTSNDAIVMETFPTTLSNKTLGAGTIAFTDTITLKHSTTNTAGELMRNTGTKFDRFAKGTAGQFLKVNATGTDLEWGAVPTAGALNDLSDVVVTTPSNGQFLKYNGTDWVNSAVTGGVTLPDGTSAPGTGRWGAFFGGSGNGMGMFGFAPQYGRLHGSSNSATESVTTLYTPSSTNAIAEFKTGTGFRRDSTCVFKAKWQLTSSAGGKVKIGLSDAAALPAGGSGTQNTRYNVTQSGAGHLEFDGGVTRLGVRFDASASGLNEAVTEVTVRFRKYGSPSGSATVGIRKNSDGTLITLGTFTPNSFGSGEQTTTINGSSNTYQMLTNDRVVVEFPSNSTDGLELDEDTASSPSGYTSQQWTGSSWSSADNTIAMQIKCSAGGGTSGNTPLNNANGVMVHGTIGTHTNYRVARNNGGASQTEEDSTKALANTTSHTLEIQINTTNCVVILDGTTFTYTTTIPATTTNLAWFMHLETESAIERGLSIAYAQVVVTS